MTKEESAKLAAHMTWCSEAFFYPSHGDFFCGYHGLIVKVAPESAKQEER